MLDKEAIMEKKSLFKIIPLALLLSGLPCTGLARDIAPIVSVDWLETNLQDTRLIVLDVRRVEQFREGHIPKAVNVFYGAWAFKKGDLYTEVPELDDLFEMIGYAGIGYDSLVVVVGKTDTPRESYHIARVACTLQYAGIVNVALLDGGYSQWVKEKKAVSSTMVRGKVKPFAGSVKPEMFANKQYVLSRMGQMTLLDVREPDYFTGKRKMDCIPKPGRMPGAINLPTSCAFTDEGMFKDQQTLAALAEKAAGADRSKEIVTYCDTGQCCPTWSYILKEVLGYSQVRIYDGAMQEWMQNSEAPVVP
jgi:thiosulfate/3-mercaptopyruvate sulfurtransferase